MVQMVHSVDRFRMLHEMVHECGNKWCNGAATMQVDDMYGIAEAIRKNERKVQNTAEYCICVYPHLYRLIPMGAESGMADLD
jgi:hypothetical protein